MNPADLSLLTLKQETPLSYEYASMLINLDTENEILLLAQAANEIRKLHTKNTIDFCSLINAKSGSCSEDCAFCSQSSHHISPINTYAFVSKESILEKARATEAQGSKRFCIVTSGGALTDAEFKEVLEAYRTIKKHTKLAIDGSLGFLTEERAQKLKAVGLSRYNHNLETSPSYYEKICTTHTYEQRLETIRLVKKFGIEVCSGGIIGMGESREDRLQLAFALKNEGVPCIPINILNPQKGTPLENIERISPLEVIKTIAIFRLIHPSATIKIAGGREQGLKDKQQLSLEAGGNGFIIGGYLTTMGNNPEEDIKLARNAGFDL